MVAQCRQPGVSIAGVALANGLNANLLRRWVVEREQGSGSGTAVASQRTSSRTTEGEFVPVRVAADSSAHGDIRIALQGRAVLAVGPVLDVQPHYRVGDLLGLPVRTAARGRGDRGPG